MAKPLHQHLPLKIQKALQLGRSIKLVWQSGPVWTLASGAVLLAQSILPLLGIYLMKLIVDAVARGMAAPDETAALGHIVWLIVLTAAVGVAASVAQALAGLIGQAQEQAVTDHMHDVLHAKSVEVDLEYYENPEYFDTLHVAQQEAPYRPARIVNGLLQFGQNGLSLLGVVALLLTLHWALAAVLFAAAVPAVYVRIKYARRTFDWQWQATPTQRRSWYLNWILTGQDHAKELRLFGLGPLFIEQFHRLRERLRRERLALAARQSAAELATTVSATLAIFGAFGFFAWRAVHGAITIGDLVMYYQAFQRGQGFLLDMMRGLASLYEDNLFLASFYRFLAIERRVAEPARPRSVPRPMRKGIVFEHVSFRYPGGTRPVLEDVSLAIAPRQVVALVGANGSGKTTLIKLLCRLYEPTGGRITLDGANLREYATTDLRRQFSAVLQDYAHYNMEARENIRLGNVELAPDDERIVAAARQAGADGVIRSLPRGYETILGRQFEDGEELSTGQWQSVALARAFVRDAQLIIMDEPTSALDAHAEFEVFERFRRLAEGRAALVISHRLSTVRLADWIYVLANGRIVESGTHDELLSQGGAYARLFETQAQYYR